MCRCLSRVRIRSNYADAIMWFTVEPVKFLCRVYPIPPSTIDFRGETHWLFVQGPNPNSMCCNHLNRSGPASAGQAVWNTVSASHIVAHLHNLVPQQVCSFSVVGGWVKAVLTRFTPTFPG